MEKPGSNLAQLIKDYKKTVEGAEKAVAERKMSYQHILKKQYLVAEADSLQEETCKVIYLAILGVKAFKLKINIPLIIDNQSVGAALNHIFDKKIWQLVCKTNVAYNKELRKANFFFERDQIKESKAKKK